MIKFFAFFNLAGFLLLNWLFNADVAITQDLPAQMAPGTEARVTVTVDKGNIEGFAKLQIELPQGLSATAIETNGASFTFADGKAKFIWMALPTAAEFTVSYTLTVAPDAQGSFPITGQLSYIADNQRVVVDVAPRTLIVGQVSASQPRQQEPVTAPAQAPTATGIGAGSVKATRTVTVMGPGEILAEITIDKGILRGFGKLQETLPKGFSAVEKNNDGAIFSMSGQTVKFVWLNMPAKDELHLSYRLLATGEAEGTYTVDGEFGYLLNDLTQRVAIGPSTFTIGPPTAQEDQIAQAQETVQQPTQEPEPVQPTKTGQVREEVQQPVAEQQAPVVEQEEAPSVQTPTRVTSTPHPETGINFKVQITAAHREVGADYFAQKHNYHGEFSIEHHQGWIKYVTGNFDRYKKARDQREAYIHAQYQFPGPFVTAYNNGERISVQEALMVAKQNWVP